MLTEATVFGAPRRLYLLNANSLIKDSAMEQLRDDLLYHQVDVAVITETHLNSRHTSESFAIEGYDLLRRDRGRRDSGGVAVYAAHQVLLELKPSTFIIYLRLLIFHT